MQKIVPQDKVKMGDTAEEVKYMTENEEKQKPIAGSPMPDSNKRPSDNQTQLQSLALTTELIGPSNVNSSLISVYESPQT
jgi:hypothetical protein